MTAVAGFQDTVDKLATKGFFIPAHTAAQGSPTAAAVGSGMMNVIPWFNNIGTTLMSTLVSAPSIPAPGASAILANVAMMCNNNRSLMFGWWYLIGTLNLAATGDQFTHNAATFPLLRTRMGQANQPVPLFPFLALTTATATTAPQFLVKNGAGSNGYVDQDGNTVVGTRTFTFPSATTAVQSGYALPLETTDGAVRDITNINVTVAGSAGAANIYGFEPFCSASLSGAAEPAFDDMLGESLSPLDLRPAVATSGTVTAYFGVCSIGGAGQSNALYWDAYGALNT